MFSSTIVCLLAALRKNNRFHTIRLKDGTLANEETIWFRWWSGSRYVRSTLVFQHHIQISRNAGYVSPGACFVVIRVLLSPGRGIRSTECPSSCKLMHSYLCQGYVFACVCLFVNRIIQKLLIESFVKFYGIVGHNSGTKVKVTIEVERSRSVFLRITLFKNFAESWQK